jgi:hypothetical protein
VTGLLAEETHGRGTIKVDGRGIGPLSGQAPETARGTKHRPQGRDGLISRPCRSNRKSLIVQDLRVLTLTGCKPGGGRANVRTNRVSGRRRTQPSLTSWVMERRVGNDPTTSRLVGGCSVQLSYRRVDSVAVSECQSPNGLLADRVVLLGRFFLHSFPLACGCRGCRLGSRRTGSRLLLTAALDVRVVLKGDGPFPECVPAVRGSDDALFYPAKRKPAADTKGAPPK